MTKDEFRKHIEKKLQGFSREQQGAFALHCALYALPLLAQGTKSHGAFGYWKEKDKAKHLFNVCYVLVAAYAYADVAYAAYAAYDDAAAAAAAADAADADAAVAAVADADADAAAYAAAYAVYATATAAAAATAVTAVTAVTTAATTAATAAADAADATATVTNRRIEDNAQEYITRVLDNMADKKTVDIVRFSDNSEQWHRQKDFFWRSLAAHGFAYLQPILEQLYKTGTVDEEFVKQAKKIDDVTKENGAKAIQKALGLDDVAVAQRALNEALRKIEFLEKQLKEKKQNEEGFEKDNDRLGQLEQEKAATESRLQAFQEADRVVKEKRAEEEKEKVSNTVRNALGKLEQPSAYINDHILLQQCLAIIWLVTGAGCIICLSRYTGIIYWEFITEELSPTTTFVQLFARVSPLLVLFSLIATVVYQFNLNVKNIVALKENQRRLNSLKQVLDIYIDLSPADPKQLRNEIHQVIGQLVRNTANAYSQDNAVDIQVGDTPQNLASMAGVGKQQAKKALKE